VVRVRPWGPSARMALSRRLINFRFPSFSFPVEAPLSLILERGLQARRCEHLTPLWTRVKGETTKVNRYLCSFALGSTIWNFRMVKLDLRGNIGGQRVSGSCPMTADWRIDDDRRIHASAGADGKTHRNL